MKRINLKRVKPERHLKRKLMEPNLVPLLVRIPRGTKEEIDSEADDLGVTTGLYIYAMLKVRPLKKIAKILDGPIK
jgi:hypothetical protein